MAYFSLVRSTLDYSASVWDPHLKKDQTKLEMLNRCSARFVTNDYNNTTSVTTMLNTLQWPSPDTRREKQCLVLMYKIVHGLVAVPSDKLIPTDGRTRSNHSYKFETISSSTSVYKNSFFLLLYQPGTLSRNTLDSFKVYIYK